MNKDKLIPELRFPAFEKFGAWDRTTLEYVADSESSNLALNKIENKENGYPVYGADSIVGYMDEYQQEEKYISIVKDGSGVGRLHLCLPKSSILGTLACIKSKDVEKFNLDWIYYLMNTIDFTSYKKGSGIPHIYFSDFKIEPIGVPQPQEQQKIASCLSSLDELLAAHNDKLDALKDHKKGLLQNLFPNRLNHDYKGFKDGYDLENQKKSSNQVNPGNHGSDNVPKVRFPEFEGDGDDALSLSKGWVEKKLGDCLLTKPEYGLNAPAVPYSNDLPTYLRITDISEDGNFLSEAKVSVDRDVSDNDYLSEGDIVLARTGASVGKSYKYRNKDGALVFAGFLIRVKPNPVELDSELLFQIFATSTYWEWVRAVSVRSGQPGINGTQYAKMPIDLPPTIQEQQKIASCLSAVDELITAQQEKIDELQQHKKGLMQGLFPKMSETGFTGLLDDQDFDSDKKSGNQVNQKNHGSDNG